ncbi:MAG: hypothetical protein V7742_00240 [Halioglobus sp.]
MAAIAFDTLKAARHLIEAGMPPRQAEAQAEVMAEAFVFNVDSLVTKDYLDARFGELDARVDARFGEQDARMDARFSEQDACIDKRFGEVELQFARVDGKFRLVYWMLTVVIISTTVPALKALFSG